MPGFHGLLTAVMKKLFYALCFVVTIFLAGGCRSFWGPPEGEGAEQLPWNQPESWEGQVIGVPY